MSEAQPTLDTRSRILIAAAEMLTEIPMSGLSVRAVAARANVSTGSVRHFFPSQRQLLDTVVAGLFTLSVDEDPIHDLTLSPEDRLLACLRFSLNHLGVAEHARSNWHALYVSYAKDNLDQAQREQYLAIERVGINRIASWIRTLLDEAICTDQEVERRAQFLATVMSGLFTERVLPSEDIGLDRENNSLRLAVKAVLIDLP
nr:TetR/AcrR family transcriptional regulator [uncultured Devosia sp.]